MNSVSALGAWKTEYDVLISEIVTQALASLGNGSSAQNDTYLSILKEELVPALGCTEPIAIAYASAKAKEVLGNIPDRVTVKVSDGIIKNAKSVIVPNTNGLKGIEAAAVAGFLSGNSEKKLNVLSYVDKAKALDYISKRMVEVLPFDNEDRNGFEIEVKECYRDSYSIVKISKYHTNIVHIEKDGNVILDIPFEGKKDFSNWKKDREALTIAGIYDFANKVDISLVKDILERQIKLNYAIAEEGIKNHYGSSVGRLLLQMGGDGTRTKARAMAAAGSDARMSGCDMPVIINSGSGNQGITCSVPVIVYAKAFHADNEKLLRALIVSNLIAIHIKSKMGIISAFCGATCAGAAAGAGIAYLLGGDLDVISHTVINAIAMDSGIICDGAKPSCAAKISLAVESGITGYFMAIDSKDFESGDGIVGKDAETTINSVGKIASEGMKDTNKTILEIMTEK